MHKVLIIACSAIFVSFAFSSILRKPKNLIHHINKNGTSGKNFLEKEVLSLKLNKSDNFTVIDQQFKSDNLTVINQQFKSDNLTVIDPQFKILSNDTEVEITRNESNVKSVNFKNESYYRYSNKVLESIPMLQKIHARITRSKDAVWATITLTFMCILLVLSVAQSRMWKDNFYVESQGVPLPNFNERVLFKDVMERKISTMKNFFKKKKSKEKEVTELESLLPPSEWEN